MKLARLTTNAHAKQDTLLFQNHLNELQTDLLYKPPGTLFRMIWTVTHTISPILIIL